MDKCSPFIIGRILFLASFSLMLPYSSAVKQCFNCRGNECRTNEDARVETCVRYDDVCVTWRYRKSNPTDGIQAGDVYKKGCAVLLVVIDGCRPDGKYDRCVCRKSSNCNARGATYEPATTTITPQGRSFGKSDFEQPVKAPESETTTQSIIITTTITPQGRSFGKSDFEQLVKAPESETTTQSIIITTTILPTIITTTTTTTTAAAETTTRVTSVSPDTTVSSQPETTSTVHSTFPMTAVPVTTKDPKKGKDGERVKKKKAKKVDPEVEKMEKMFSLTTSLYDD